MTESVTSPPAAIAHLLSNAGKIVAMTGAGISAESGIPAAKSGLWAKFDSEQLATRTALQKVSALVWGWYRGRTAMLEKAQSNAGHTAVANSAAAEGLPPVVERQRGHPNVEATCS